MYYINPLHFTFELFFTLLACGVIAYHSLVRTAQDFVSRMHQESHRRKLVLARATMVPSDIASECIVRVCTYVRVNLNKSHMSFPYARVTQPVVCVYVPAG